MNFKESSGAVPFRNNNEIVLDGNESQKIDEIVVNLENSMQSIEIGELFKDFQTKIDIYSPFSLDEIDDGTESNRPSSPALLSTGQKDLETEIIVIGSFLDKLPNQAGLARTCEIFGVKTLYVPDLSALSSTDFINVAMTAEKWLDIRQLMVKDITQFLENIKKEQGNRSESER